jgi:hypothetical protein
MRAEAPAEQNPITDPRLIRQAETALAGISAEWLSRVVGRPAAGWRQSWAHHKLIVAVRAAEADAGHFQAAAEEEASARAEANRAALGKERAAAAKELRAWEDLRSRQARPYRVRVAALTGDKAGDAVQQGELGCRERPPLRPGPFLVHVMRNARSRSLDQIRPQAWLSVSFWSIPAQRARRSSMPMCGRQAVPVRLTAFSVVAGNI